MRNMFLAAAGLALTLGSCSWLPKQSEFERVGEGRSLEIPPDLDEPDTSSAVRVPNAIYSAVRGGVVEQAEATDPALGARLMDHEGTQVLALDEALDGAWRRVGIALERNGMDIQDSDQTSKLYRFDYVDRRAKQERPGAFSRWVLRRKGPVDHSGTYQLRLESLDEKLTLIHLFADDGGIPPAAVKDQILGSLRDSLG